MSENKPKERKQNPITSFISGGFGGTCSVLVGHPLDTIKVRLQTMPIPEAGEKPLFTGTLDCAKKIVQSEGFLGLYKGITVPLAGITPIYAICFFGYDFARWFLQKDVTVPLTYPQLLFAGAFSGLCTTGITAPGERIKCLLQVQQSQSGVKKYNGILDTAVKLYKEGGISSVYKGTCATMLRDIPANAFYFIVYEYFKRMLMENTGSKDASMTATTLAGGAAGVAYWVVGMPADVIKSRLQTAPEGTYPNGVRSVFKELMAKDGPIALYRGVQPVMIRAFPANAITFWGLELANKFFDQFLPEL